MRKSASWWPILVAAFALWLLSLQSSGGPPFCITDVGDDSPFDVSEIELNSYRQYVDQAGEIAPFEARRIYETSVTLAADSLICIVVNDSLYPAIADSLGQYREDVEAQGYSVVVYACSGGTPVDLRMVLQGLLPNPLVGAVLVGDLPIAWYEMSTRWGYSLFPIDLYYADLDGVWADTNSNGINDKHTGDVEPEIFVGRLTASPLTYGGATESSLLLNYFGKNHRYRTYGLSLTKRALAYIDDPFSGFADGIAQDISTLYPEVDVENDSMTTNATDYGERLSSGAPRDYEMVFVSAHGSPDAHHFMLGTGWDPFYSSQLTEVNARSLLCFSHGCLNGRYVSTDYIAGWYAFCPTYGQVAIASAKVGVCGPDQQFYQDLRDNRTIGDAYRGWFTRWAELSESARWVMYGMTLLGDPLLDFVEIAYHSHVVDDDSTGPSVGDGDGMIDAAETVELPVTLVNHGSKPFQGVKARLTTTDTLVTILDYSEEYGNILVGDTATSYGAYLFTVSPSCPDRHQVPFILEINAASLRPWLSGFRVLVGAPVIQYYSHTIDDTAFGNGDGNADPGETVYMTVDLANSGLDGGDSVHALLSTTDPYVAVSGDSVYFGAIEAGSTASSVSPYGFSVDSGVPGDPHIVTFSLEILAGSEYLTTDSFSISVGDSLGFYDDMEAGLNGWDHCVVTPGYCEEWHQSMRRNHTSGGYTSWWCGDTGTGFYSNLDDAGLVTPEIRLGQDFELKFWHWIDAEIEEGTSQAWDGGIVEINDGSGWSQIDPVGGYPYTIIENPDSPFPGGIPCYSGTHAWSLAQFDLSDYSGTVRFRYRFGTDASMTLEGWYIDDVWVGIALGLEEEGRSRIAVAGSQLVQNHPNPWRESTTINYQMPGPVRTGLRIYNVTGRLVRTLVDEEQTAGCHSTRWDGRDDAGQEVASGIYFYRLTAGDFTATRKLVVLK